MQLVGIIPTLNRHEDIKRLFDSVRNIKPVHDCQFSLLLVDNSADANLQALSDELTCPYPLTYIHQPQKGLSNARNAALSQLPEKTDYVCTIDDDLILPDSYLQDIITITNAHPNAGIIGGRVELFDQRDLPITIKTSMVGESYEGGLRLFGFMHGCCMLIAKKVIDHVGIFDTKLGAGTHCGSAEDTDYYYRAWRLGYPVLYSPEWYVLHNHGRRHEDERVKLKQNYDTGQGAFFYKHIRQGNNHASKLLYWEIRSTVLSKLRLSKRHNKAEHQPSRHKWLNRLAGMNKYRKSLQQGQMP